MKFMSKIKFSHLCYGIDLDEIDEDLSLVFYIWVLNTIIVGTIKKSNLDNIFLLY
jgi:hypothetical protein